ncbi:unnamed protein product [Trichogramma brassicae]|uniref:Uncharacterized protein n=1 Tax=Trichogramma brassicae TaxID=86971 RepID=A0A6H5IWL7_9HYME|nr:unnamed protein product [Trichogramma brassicae]
MFKVKFKVINRFPAKKYIKYMGRVGHSKPCICRNCKKHFITTYFKIILWVKIILFYKTVRTYNKFSNLVQKWRFPEACGEDATSIGRSTDLQYITYLVHYVSFWRLYN